MMRVYEAGSFLSHYRIDRALGHGGMGSVYGAVDQRNGEHVVLKILRPDLAKDPQFIERMYREARTAATLHHPNIVAAYDFHSSMEAAFVVMEWLHGRTLGARLRQECPLSPVMVAV